MYCRVLGEVAKELRAEQSSIVAKQTSEAQFLKQKAHQYQKLVSTMKVYTRSLLVYGGIYTFTHYDFTCAKEELVGSGYQPNISHGSLQELAKVKR